MSEAPPTTDAGTTPVADAPPPDEFAHVPNPRRRPPFVAVGVILLAAFLIFHERADLMFALSSSVPQDIGDASRLTGPPAANRLVRVRGVPDRESALVLDTQGSWEFTQFFRLLGTGSRLFVQRVPDPLSIEAAESDRYTGRLLAIADLPFDASIRSYFSSHVTATHFFAPIDVHAAVTKGAPLVLRARGGDAVTLAATETLAVDVARPGVWLIQIPCTRAATRKEAIALVVDKGGTLPDPEPTAKEGDPFHSLNVALPESLRTAALSAYADLDPNVQIRAARQALAVKVSDLAAAPGALVIQGKSVPLEQVIAMRTTAAVEIPADAWVLLEGERPRDHLKSVFIVGFLLAFALVNLLALRRAA